MLFIGYGKLDTEYYEKIDNDFKIISYNENKVKEDIGSDTEHIIIVEHKETGQKYIIYRGYRKGEITPLIENSDNK